MASVKMWDLFGAKMALTMHILILSECLFAHGRDQEASNIQQKIFSPFTERLSEKKHATSPCEDQVKSNIVDVNTQFQLPVKLLEGNERAIKEGVDHRHLNATLAQPHDNGGNAQISETLVGSYELALRKLQSNSAPTPSSTFDATLIGNIWYDYNGDGTRGDDERSELEVAAIHVASKTENLVYTAFPNLQSGNFKIDTIAYGSYRIYVSKQAQFTHCTGDIDNDCTLDSFVIQPEAASELKIGLFKPAVVTGRVWEAVDYSDTFGNSQYYWQGVAVSLLDSDWKVLGYAETNEYGRFRFQGLPPDTYKVQLDGSPNFACTGLSLHNCTSQSLFASAGEVTSIQFGRYKLAKIKGTVSVETGADVSQFGVEGALVQIYSNNGSVLQSKDTDQNGGYEMSGLEPGTYFILIIKPEDLSMYSFVNREFEDSLNAPRFTLESGKLKTIDAILVSPTSQPTADPRETPTRSPISTTSIRQSPVLTPSPVSSHPTTFPSLFEPFVHAPILVPSDAPVDRPTTLHSIPPSALPTSRRFVSFAFVVVLRLRKMPLLTVTDILSLESVTSGFIEENGQVESVELLGVTVTLREQVLASATRGSGGGLEANTIELIGRRRYLQLPTEEDLLVELQIDLATEKNGREEGLEALLEACLRDRFYLLAKKLSESSGSFSSLTLERAGISTDVAAVALTSKTSKEGWKIVIEVMLGCLSCLGGFLLFVVGRRLVKRWKRDQECISVTEEDRDHFIHDGIDYATTMKEEDRSCNASIVEAPADKFFAVPHQHSTSAKNRIISYASNAEEEDYCTNPESQRVSAEPLGVLMPRTMFSPTRTRASMLSTIPSGSFEESLPVSATDDTASVESRHCATNKNQTFPVPQITLRHKLFGSCLAPATIHDGDFESAPLALVSFQECERPTLGVIPGIQLTRSAPAPRQNAFSPARRFLQGATVLDEEDNSHIIIESRSMPTLATQASNMYDVFAPPGPLGLIIDSSALGPVVHGIKLDSPLLNLVEVGDIICALDGVDTRQEQVNILTSTMARRMSKHRRLTIASRDSKFGDDYSLETWCEEVEI